MCGKQHEKSFRNDCCSVSCYKLKLNILHSPSSGWRVCQYCGEKYYYTHGQDDWLCDGTVGRSQSSANSIKYCCYKCGKEDRKRKIEASKFSRYGDKSYNNMDKMKQTNLKKYGTECVLGNREIIKKRNTTNLKRYGVEYPLQSSDIYRKTVVHTNATSSNEEILIYKELQKVFKEVKLHYKSEKYPYYCDFYIPSENFYIEYQGYWMHGRHPFDENNKDDIKLLKTWQKLSESVSQYKRAIDIWTLNDPLKRKTASQNKLNWLEFFSIKEFKCWLKQQITVKNNKDT